MLNVFFRCAAGDPGQVPRESDFLEVFKTFFATKRKEIVGFLCTWGGSWGAAPGSWGWGPGGGWMWMDIQLYLLVFTGTQWYRIVSNGCLMDSYWTFNGCLMDIRWIWLDCERIVDGYYSVYIDIEWNSMRFVGFACIALGFHGFTWSWLAACWLGERLRSWLAGWLAGGQAGRALGWLAGWPGSIYTL